MSNTRVTRSSVLGKRRAEPSQSSSVTTKANEQQLVTPDSTPNPKRPRTSVTRTDGDANKENIPPFKCEAVNEPQLSARATRALRRTSTESTFTTPSRQSLRRNASTPTLIPATPAAAISHLSLATPPPTPPTLLLPIYARARALLRATCNNSTTQIAGRDVERNTIRSFITSDSTSSLYISGTPGTGKTALVNAILRELEQELDQVKIITVNCMALNNVDALWNQLAEELDANGKHKANSRAKKAKGREAIKAQLATRKTKCVLVLDELDHIASCPTALATIFSLPSSANFRLIGIANTHTLTSSTSSLSDNNVHTLHFSPYTPSQLLDILMSRLRTLCDDTPEGTAERKKFLPQPSLMLLTKKVAAITGDVRTLLEVLRGAIDLAVVAVAPKSPEPKGEDNPLNTPTPSVTPTHVLDALRAYTPTNKPSASAPSLSNTTSISEVVNKVQNVGLQGRLVLLALILAFKRVEASLPLTESPSSSSPSKSPMKRSHSLPASLPASNSGIDTSLLYTLYTQILTRGETGVLSAVSRSEFADLVGMLEGVGLILSSGNASCLPLTASPSKTGRRTFGRTASFGGIVKAKGSGGEVRLVDGVRVNEILRGLGVIANDTEMNADDVDPREEEVRILWTREVNRIAKESKAAERIRLRKDADGNPFGEAMED